MCELTVLDANGNKLQEQEEIILKVFQKACVSKLDNRFSQAVLCANKAVNDASLSSETLKNAFEFAFKAFSVQGQPYWLLGLGEMATESQANIIGQIYNRLIFQKTGEAELKATCFLTI